MIGLTPGPIPVGGQLGGAPVKPAKSDTGTLG